MTVFISETENSCINIRRFMISIDGEKEHGYSYFRTFAYYTKKEALKLVKDEIRKKLGVKRLNYYHGSL